MNRSARSSFPVQEDEHLYALGYVERNALRAGLVRGAEQWQWCSLHRWLRGSVEDRELLAAWPPARKPGRIVSPDKAPDVRTHRPVGTK